MATQQYDDNVIINGTEDEVQLQVQGTVGQTEALQEWQNDNGDVLAQISAEGRIQSGDMGLSTPDALIEAHRDQGSSLPKRGLHSLGKVAGVISTAIAWLVGELELVGTATISSIHSAIRGRLTHSSSGDSSNAELRAGDFEVINQSGTSGTPVGTAIAVQGTVNNQTNAYLSKASGVVAQIQNATGADIETAVALEVASPVNGGTIDTLIGLDIPDINQGTDSYAIRTGEGVVQLGDVVEMAQQVADPANKANLVQFYAKDDKIFAKAPDPDNTVYDLTQGIGGGNEVYLDVLRGTGGYPANSPVYIGADGRAYLFNEYMSNGNGMGSIRGFSLDAGAENGASIVQLKGILGGFSGLTPGKKVYFRTPSSISHTQPEDTINETKAIGEMGVAISATEVYIDPKPIQYHYRTGLKANISEEDIFTLEHQPDVSSYGRKVWAYAIENTPGTVIADNGVANLDSDMNLRGIETLYTADQCVGGTASASSTYGAYVASNAFNDLTGDSATTRWLSNVYPSIGTPQTLQYQFSASKTVKKYTVYSEPNGQAPASWDLEYYDGSAWQVADVVTGLAASTWSPEEAVEFYVDGSHSSTQWRLSIKESISGLHVSISNVEMMEVDTTVTRDKLAQTFTLASSTDIASIGLWLKKVGQPSGDMTTRIETISNGLPTGTLADPSATGVIWKSGIDEDYSEILVDLANTVTLVAGTYAIVLELTGTASATDYIAWATDSTEAYGNGEMLSEVSNVWSSEAKDAIFAIYEPGTSLATQVSVDSWIREGAEIVNRYGDALGANPDTHTTFKITRPSGFYEATFVVEID